MSKTISERLRQAAQCTALHGRRELLIEAAEALECAVCRTCNGHGMIGGPSYYSPDEGGEPCPDCSPQPKERKPLTDDKAVEGFCSIPHPRHYVQAFIAGVRFAESEHGIKGERG